MQIKTIWNEKMVFTASSGGHEVKMDTKSPLGSDSALTPKQLVLAGLAGCTAMDVISLLKKFKQPVEKFEITVAAEKSKGVYPEVFISAQITFQLNGNIDKEKLIFSVHESQTKYCGVSAMLSKAFPISYSVELNGEKIAEGKSNFNS